MRHGVTEYLPFQGVIGIMKRWTRFLGIVTSLLMVLVATGFPAQAAAEESINPMSLRAVKEVLKLSPSEIKELHQKVQDGQIGINGIVGGGFWWGGTWLDVLNTNFERNNTGQTPMQEILRLGSGRCETDTVTTSITLSIKGTQGSNYQNAINTSFEFSAIGSRTWTRTESYCGPQEPNMLRIFYKHGVYNDYRAVVVRMYFDWDGRLTDLQTMENRIVQVPHPAYPTQDIPWQG